MNLWITLLYVVTLASFAPPLILAGFLWVQGRVPLAANYLRFQLVYLGFLLALFGAYLSLANFPGSHWQIEVFFNTLFFLLYASLGYFVSRFLTELVQQRWQGLWRRAAEGFAVLGVVVPLAVHALVFDGADRAQTLTAVLNGGYFVVFLVGISVLFLRTALRRSALADDWKRHTAGGASLLYFLAVPFFLIDALWPVLQADREWIPRGLNLQVVPLLAWNFYFTWRWFSFPLQHSAPAPTGEPSTVLMELMTGREREIALLLLQGKSNQEICDSLNVRMGTTKNHIYNIFNKTGASSRKEFCRMLIDR